MRWAMGPNGTAIHVFSLPREFTGAKCACTCPGCGEALHAVNAGIYSNGNRLPMFSNSASGRSLSSFFRHPAGHARGSCMQKASQLAALTLFRTREVIDVPAPRGVQTVPGISGRRYRAEVIGQPQRLAVRRTLWSDEQQAFLETTTGEKVLVILHSAYTGQQGKDCDGVITVACDDPEIAGMSLDELLTKVALNDSHTCWAKHWSSEVLSAQALAEAQAQAFEALDWLPSEMVAELGDLPLTGESLLHVTIKQIISQAKYIVTPAFSEEITRTASDDSAITWSKYVSRSSKRVKLENIRLEHWMPGMVPDIYCDAVHEKSRHQLLIEVKVTHGVTVKKLELIRSKKFLCMEVDVALFSKHGQLTRTQLKEEVLDRAACKVWLHHPSIEAEIKNARAELLEKEARYRREQAAAENVALEERRKAAARAQEKAEEKAMQKRLAEEKQARHAALARIEEEKEQAYRRWLSQRNTEDLMDMFGAAAAAKQRSYFLKEAPPKNYESITSSLRERGYHSVQDGFFTAMDGPLSVMVRIQHLSEQGEALPDDLLKKLAAYSWMYGGQEYLPVILWAMKRYPLKMSAEQAMEVEKIRKGAWESIQNGSVLHVRNEDRDPLIAKIFPELSSDLARPEGKSKYARERADKVKKTVEADKMKKRLESYEVMLTKLGARCWAKKLPIRSDYERLCSVYSPLAKFEDIEGVGQAKLQRALRSAYGDAKKGGAIGSWLSWAVVELGGDRFKSEGNLLQLIETLKKLKLLTL